MEQNLPAEITWRKGKIGFEPPQKEWMQNKQVQETDNGIEKKTSARKKYCKTGILNEPINPASAHDSENYDWRYLCAATIFSK